MSKILNDGLTRSDTGCSIAVPTMATVGIKGLKFLFTIVNDTVELLNGVVEGDGVRTVNERVPSLDNNRRAGHRPLSQNIAQYRFGHLTIQVTDVHSIHRRPNTRSRPNSTTTTCRPPAGRGNTGLNHPTDDFGTARKRNPDSRQFSTPPLYRLTTSLRWTAKQRGRKYHELSEIAMKMTDEIQRLTDDVNCVEHDDRPCNKHISKHHHNRIIFIY